MPAAVAGAAAWWGTVGYAGLTYGTWVTLALTAYSAISANHQRRKAARQARDSYNSSLEDRLVMTSTANGARSRIYGECRAVDGVIFKGTHGANSQYYTLVVALAGHECESIEKVYLNDQEVELESDGAGGYWVVTEPYRRRQVFSATAAMTNASGGAAATLPYTPIPESLSAVATNAGGDNGPVTWEAADFDIDGTTVSLETVDPSYTLQVAYQYLDDRPKIRIWQYLGTDSQDIGTDLLASRFPALINTGSNDDRFAGICCMVVECEYDQDAFPTGLPNITALVRGAKVFDPRDDTTAWTQNPSLIALDWSKYSNGGACLDAEVDEAAAIAAANACDVATEFETPDGTEERPLYQCDIVCQLSVPPDQHLAEIVESMAGKNGWAGGVLRWVAGVYRAPVADITEDWVSDAESIVLVPQPPRSEVVNVYRPRIALADIESDEDTGQTAAYTLAPLKEVRNETYITEDGEELPRDVELNGVQHAVHAQHICGVLMRDAHEGLVVKLPCNYRAWPLELFDVVTLTLPSFGFDEKEIEVLGWAFSVEKGVILTLKETAAAIFDPDLEFEQAVVSPNTTLVLPWVVPDVENFSVVDAPADGTQQCRALASWDAITAENVRQSGQVEVQYRAVTDTYSEADWQSWPEAGSATSTIIPGLVVGVAYMVRARAVNTLRVRGNWCTQVLYSPTVPLIDTVQLAPGSVTQTFALTSVQPLPESFAYGFVDVDGIIITPDHDCVAEVIATFDGAATGSPGGDWGGAFFGTYACPTSDITEDGFTTGFHILGDSAEFDFNAGVAAARASYSVDGRFELEAGTEYKLGLFAIGSAPDIGITHYATVYAAKVYVTLIIR